MHLPPGKFLAQRQNNPGRAKARVVFAFLGLALAAGVLAPSHAARASVAVDAVGPNGGGATGGAVSSLSWTHTVSGANRLLTVGLAVGTIPDTGITAAVTYNGVAMASAGKVHTNNSTSGYVQLFYLASPATGPNTVAVTLTGGTADLVGGSVSFTGVNQGTPVRNTATAFGNGTSATVNVASAFGDMVVDAVANGSPVNGSTKTNQWLHNLNGNTGAGNGAQSTAPGASTVTMGYSLIADNWGIIGMDIVAAQGIQVSSRSDTLSNSQPSATSNHTVAFTTNTAISGSSSTVSFVQVTDSGNNSCGTGSTSITTCNVTLTGVTANSTLLIFLYAGVSPESVTSLTDSNGTVSGPYLSTNPTGASGWVYYVRTAAAGSHTVTVNYSAGAWLDMAVAEYKGANAISPLDGAGCSSTGSSNPLSCPLAATARNDLLVGYCLGANNTCTAGSFFGTRDANDGQIIEDKTATGTGSLSVTSSSNFASGPGGIMGIALQPAGSTLTLTLDPAFGFQAGMDCGDVDVATASQFNFNWPACAATATAWGFSATGSVVTLTSPTSSGVHVPAGTPMTIKIGSNATVQQQGVHWITNPSSGGVYTISLGGTFGGSGNMLVSINSGVTVSANVAESLSLTVSPSATSMSAIKLVQEVSCSGCAPTITAAATGSGRLLVVALSFIVGGGGPASGLTDNATGGTNTYVNAGALATDTNGGSMDIWYAKNSRPGATQITASGGGSPGAVFWEFSGIDTVSPLDAASSLSNQSASLTPTGSLITTTLPGELVISNATVQNTVTHIHAGNAFTNDSLQGGDGWAHLIATSTATFQAQWDQNSSGTYAADAVSFKPAAGCTADDGATVNQFLTTATSVPFGIITPNAFYQGCQDLTVSTNAGNGYSLTVQESHAMMTADGRFTIPDTMCDAGACSVATATTWVTPTNNGLGHTCFNQSGSDCNPTYGNGTKFKPVPNVAAGTTSPISLVQSKGTWCISCSGSGLSVTPDSPIGANHLLVVFALACIPGDAFGCTTATISDTLSNTWSASTTITNGNNHGAATMWYTCASKSGSDTITIAETGAPSDDLHLHVYEVSGVTTSGCLDTTGTSSGTGNAASSVTTSQTVVQSNEYVTAFFADWDANATWTQGSGYTSYLQTNSTNGDSAASEVGNATSGLSGKQTATMTKTNTADTWLAIIAAFKATPQSGQTLMSNTGTVTNSTGRVKYRLSASSGQPAGIYTTIITYTILGTF